MVRKMPRYSLRKNFKPGDLLYGVENDRATYYAMVTLLGGYFITADRYNKLAVEPHLDHDGDFEEDSAGAASRLAEATATHGLTARDLQRVASYSTFLLHHPRYSPVLDGGKGFEDEKKIRRACKAAIDYITSRQGRRLHFLLDSLDMNRIINKTDTSMTGSELRYIYRRWSRSADVQKRVWFYRNSVQVDPPWVTHRSAWDAYHPKSAAV